MNEEKEDEAFLHLMVLDDINKVYDFNLSYFSDDDEIDYLYNELYDLSVKAKKYLKSKLAKINYFMIK